MIACICTCVENDTLKGEKYWYSVGWLDLMAAVQTTIDGTQGGAGKQKRQSYKRERKLEVIAFPSFLLPVTSHDTWPPCIKKCHIVFACSRDTCPTITSSFLTHTACLSWSLRGSGNTIRISPKLGSPNRLVDMMPTNDAIETVRSFNLARHLHATRLLRRCGRLHPPNYEHAYKRINPYHREL